MSSSPSSSPLPSSSSDAKTITEAMRHLAAAREALASAESNRRKVMAIPLKRKGGGAAMKQKATKDYELALQACKDRQAELLAVTRRLKQINPSILDDGSQRMEIDQSEN
ncbi:hypothetical protein H0H92_014639, partial [Tricholoma furcatifolium]